MDARETVIGAPPGVEPLLFRFAEPRTGGASIPGGYDERRAVWMVDTPDGLVPIVEADAVLAELETKTKVRVESDDEADALAQLRTKTFVNEEVDDDQRGFGSLLEITTKTEAQIESDDSPEL